MRTTKPIATISYNSATYLEHILTELKRAKIVSVWHFIEHLPEDDEGGKKKHIHLYIELAKLTQTEDLLPHFTEIDPSNPGRPLKCLPFRVSKFGDWCLYALHDAAYLASKAQSRRYHYTYEDIRTSDPDELYRAYKEIDRHTLAPLKALQQAIIDGKTFADALAGGLIPLQQVRNYQIAWEMLSWRATHRDGRQTHTPPTVDPETGELL